MDMGFSDSWELDEMFIREQRNTELRFSVAIKQWWQYRFLDATKESYRYQ